MTTQSFKTWWKKLKPAECDELKRYFVECWNEAAQAQAVMEPTTEYQSECSLCEGSMVYRPKMGGHDIWCPTCNPNLNSPEVQAAVEPTYTITKTQVDFIKTCAYEYRLRAFCDNLKPNTTPPDTTAAMRSALDALVEANRRLASSYPPPCQEVKASIKQLRAALGEQG